MCPSTTRTTCWWPGATRSYLPPLRSSRTRVLVQEDVLPVWLRQVEPAPGEWLILRSLPVPGWIVQHLVIVYVRPAARQELGVVQPLQG